MNNKLSLTILGIVCLLILGAITLINQWVSLQINTSQASSQAIQKLMNKNSADLEIPHRPVIDPNNDPLAPVVKPPTKKPVSVKVNPALKIYEPSIDSVLVQ